MIEPGTNTVSVRDIIRLYNKFLTDACIEEIVSADRYECIEKISGSGSHNSKLVFDFCLAALDGDSLNAKIYLAHSFHILGLRRELTLLLSTILNEAYLLEDADVRKLITLLAKIAFTSEKNIRANFHSQSLARRYEIYIRELKRLNLGEGIRYEYCKFQC